MEVYYFHPANLGKSVQISEQALGRKSFLHVVISYVMPWQGAGKSSLPFSFSLFSLQLCPLITTFTLQVPCSLASMTVMTVYPKKWS